MGLYSYARTLLAEACKKQEGWFKESILNPLFKEGRKLHDVWLSTGLERDRNRFIKMRSTIAIRV